MRESDNIVLCAANSYIQKYYFNTDFNLLPDTVKEDLQVLCVWFTEDIGGILTLEFDPEGNLLLKTTADESDYYYDEIGAGLKLHQLQISRRELFESLELFYRTFILKIPLSGAENLSNPQMD